MWPSLSAVTVLNAAPVFKDKTVHRAVERFGGDLRAVERGAEGKEVLGVRVAAVDTHHGGGFAAALGEDRGIGIAHVLGAVGVMRRRIAAVGKEVFPALAVKAHGGLIHRGELIGKLFAELRLLAEIKGGCAAAHGVHAVREREVHDRGSNARSRERAAGGAFMIVVEKVAQRVVKAVLLRQSP